MYYPFVCRFLKSRCDNACFELSDIFNEYSLIEFVRNMKIIFRGYSDFTDPITDVYCVYDTVSHRLYFVNRCLYQEFSRRSFLFKNINKFNLRFKFYQFLDRLIHDGNKPFESMDVCCVFLHDLDAGALPASLKEKYASYRVFGHLPIYNSDVFHDTNL